MSEWLVIVFAVALIAVCVAQIVLMNQQAGLMRSLSEHIREGLSQTARTADAANSAAGTAKLALEVSTRANIVIESVTLLDPRPEGNRRLADRAARSRIEVGLKNLGATPAKDLRFEFSAEMPPYFEEAVSLEGNRAELHPQCIARPTFKPIHSLCSEFYRDADVNLCLEDLRVKGQIRYRDIFNNGYQIECSARFDPVVWQFEIVTDARSARYHQPSGTGGAAVAARVGDNGH